MFHCLNCFLIRQISEGVVNSILLLTNPSTYLLKKMKKDSKNSQNDDDATPFKNQQKGKGRNSSELNDLRKLNEQLLLPRYTKNMRKIIISKNIMYNIQDNSNYSLEIAHLASSYLM